MATTDIFLSPPVKPSRVPHYSMISSSPELPSLAEIAQRQTKRPAILRSGSNAAPIPTTAPNSFTSAKDVLRQAPDVETDADPVTQSPPPKPKPKAARKRASKSQSKPEAAVAPAQQEPIVIPSSSPTEKVKSKKAEAAQSTISSRVTKSVTAEKRKAKKKTEAVSRHFKSIKEKGKSVATKEIPQPGASDTDKKDLPSGPDETDVAAQTEYALPRRRDWTPPPADELEHGEHGELLSSSSKAPVSKEHFQNLCQDFTRPGEKEPVIKPSAEIAEFLKKRKLNDLPANEQASRSTEASPTKPAVVKKKKIRTITELAMAPYQLPDLPDVLLAPGDKDTLLKHFDFDGAVKAQVDHQRVVMDMQETKSKGKKKAPAKPRKKKAGTVEDPILLSPNSAIKQASNQDFLFGTSSQLQIDEPPAVLRDLQAAIQASNQANDDDDDDDRLGLWHKGARDFDGSLLEFKTVELADEVDTTRRSSSPVLQPSPTDNDFPDIDKICALPSQAQVASSSSSVQIMHSQQAIPSSRTTMPSSDKPAIVPPPPRPAPAAKSKRPDFTLFTDAQLSAKISAYGFKPMKRRLAMITLLEECWDNQQAATAAPTGLATSNTSTRPPQPATAATGSAPPSTDLAPVKKPRGRPKKDTTAVASTAPAAPVSQAPESPKRPRGRPRKDSASQSPVTTPVRRAKPIPKVTKVEIADSDEDEVLSVAARSSPEPVFSSPPPLDLSISDDADMSLNLSPTDQESSSFTYITKAITTAPRSTDPQNPSWHEMMLMYTPVILEDLATWLNAGELTRVGYDGEVSPLQVKQWCESKSVICLWRTNLKGGTRKRY